MVGGTPRRDARCRPRLSLGPPRSQGSEALHRLAGAWRSFSSPQPCLGRGLRGDDLDFDPINRTLN